MSADEAPRFTFEGTVSDLTMAAHSLSVKELNTEEFERLVRRYLARYTNSLMNDGVQS